MNQRANSVMELASISKDSVNPLPPDRG